ncbi:GerAB/ArcD/ProY family transporter [Peribacillus frigoritolerans]|nr:GerAB/ArcD/ProY family transporter [Peribacillus frigoritolerans]
MIVVIGSMVLVCAFSVHGGLEVIARSAEFLVPVVIILLLVIVILLIPDLEPKNLYPVMEKGIMPSLKGAVVPSSWFTEFFLISFLLPFLDKKEKGLKWGMISVFAVMLTMVVTNLFSLFLFGDITATFTYPVMSAARYINLADFLQHLDSIVMAIWVSGTFIKISVFYYAIVIGTAQWLNLSDHRPIVFPAWFPISSSQHLVGPEFTGTHSFIEHYLAFFMPFSFKRLYQLYCCYLLFCVKKTSKKPN